jgi:hypothetical protein
MEGHRLDQLAEALREAGIRQAFTPDVSRLTVRLSPSSLSRKHYGWVG